MLSAETLDLLRQWWQVRPSRHDAGTPLEERWLFPGLRSGRPMTTRQLNRLFHEAADAAGIRKGVTLHALRHSFATHLLNAAPISKSSRRCWATTNWTHGALRVATGMIASIESRSTCCPSHAGSPGRARKISRRRNSPRPCPVQRWRCADIFRDHGRAWRRANAGHVSLDHLKVMSAIERCPHGGTRRPCRALREREVHFTPSLPTIAAATGIAQVSGAAAREWLAEREAELLPVPYFHVVYTLPAAIRDIAYQNKAVIYHLLFKASAETTLTIAADRKHLGARIGFMSVLHTWGSALTHHPHVHMVVPGGGLAPDGSRWIACRPRYFLTVEVLGAVPPAVSWRC